MGEIDVDEEKETLPHTAITTWDGFIYQGKVAIYHTLKLLSDNLDLDYELQLDSFEDFAILDGTDNISFHQVKAKKSEYFSSYEKDFEKLNDKHGQCRKLYFHIAKNIDKTDEDIKGLYPHVNVYKYEDKRFCAVDEIDEKIEGLCLNIYEQHNSEDYKKEKKYCHETRIHLEQIIIDKVICIHKKNHDNKGSDRELAFTEVIPFSSFTQILTSDHIENLQSSDYFYYRIVDDFNRYYNEFINEYDIGNISLEKINSYMSEVVLFSNNQMTQFIKNIMPHRKFRFNELKDYKDCTPIQDEVKDGFYCILDSLDKGKVDHEINCINWLVGDKESFTPTMIDSRKSKKYTICSRILENAKENDLDILFENNNLVTYEIDSESIINDSKNIHDQLGENLNDNNDDSRITAFRGVKLVSLERAKEKINE